MKLSNLHTEDKEVSAKLLFKGQEGIVNALQIKEKGILKEHISKVPAVLLCVQGEVVFENELDVKKTLLPGDYIEIAPFVKHLVTGIRESQLLLLK